MAQCPIRSRVIFCDLVSSTVVLWYHRISKCKKGGTNGLKWVFERIYPDVN